MVKVRVRVFAILREELGWKENEVLVSGDRLKDLLLELKVKEGSLYEKITKDDKKLIKGWKILLNGRDIDFLDGINTKLNTNDLIAIFPPVAGGKIKDKEYWKREIAYGWKFSISEPCELCGVNRVQDSYVGYFKLVNGKGYWVCPKCFEREIKKLKDKLYKRGCRYAYLINLKEKIKYIWKIVDKEPWVVEEKI